MTIDVIPAGHRVLIKVDELLEIDEVYKSAEKAGIVLAKSEEVNREKIGVSTGILWEIGMTAWQGFDEGKPWAKVGDRVAFAKYAGKGFRNDDKELYVVVSDEDVIALIGEDVHV